MEKKPVIAIENIGKVYDLGKIGGTTVQKSLQSWWAKQRGKEDPNRRIGQRIRPDGKFEALKGISCTIREGERVGIIGRNGAGKSTLLKLLSRVTAPTEGRIAIKGKVSAMLEVGTGFHGELTGRENIYLNGAILGMSQQEITEKLKDIIEFSECEQFIDTPVKRYSSGMYVRLAFSVAAFLNADIFLMDEVLAVGDMQFQKKCLNKMKEISEDQNKTILYVSHNMQTIRELCDRCIVLENGCIIHDGDVETGINLYRKEILEIREVYEFTRNRDRRLATGNVWISRIQVDSRNAKLLEMDISMMAETAFSGLHLRMTVYDSEDVVVGTAVSHSFSLEEGEGTVIRVQFDDQMLTEGNYYADLAVVEPLGIHQTRHCFLRRAIAFKIEKRERLYEMTWQTKAWGNVELPDLFVRTLKKEEIK